MQLIIPPNISKKLSDALSKAKTQEIGGILMGEHLAEDRFKVSDITIQRRGGSFASFVRNVRDIVGPLRRFFGATSYNYTRYNYLGEWHSHPSFLLSPSDTDRSTMRDIIEDSQVGANFVVLLIVRLSRLNGIEGSVLVYTPGGIEYLGTVTWESE
jgi:[CysO sulfur-carrier protein]-S-L-cysteine hydrolase